MKSSMLIGLALLLCPAVLAQPKTSLSNTEIIKEKPKSPTPQFPTIASKQAPRPFFKPDAEGIIHVNNAKAIIALSNDNPIAIAKRYNIPYRIILWYNDMDKNHFFDSGQHVFLQSKHRDWYGENNRHIVRAGETMYDISQRYGIRLRKLYKKNKLIYGQQPIVGEVILIRGKRTHPPSIDAFAKCYKEKEKKAAIRGFWQAQKTVIQEERFPQNEEFAFMSPSSIQPLPEFEPEPPIHRVKIPPLTRKVNATLPIPRMRDSNLKYSPDNTHATSPTTNTLEDEDVLVINWRLAN